MAQDMEEVPTDGVLRTPSSQIVGLFESAGQCLGAAVRDTRQFAARLRQRAETIKEEQPLQFIAVVAGVSVAAGFATRLWRSSRNA